MTDGGPLSNAETEHYQTNGYVLRPAVFREREIAEMAAECERLVDRLVRNRNARRRRFGSYVFDADEANGVIIKWEGETDIVHGLEPFAHLSHALERWAYDERFVAPVRSLLGCETPMLFTEKLNLKRPFHGGPNPLHQDYPYWIDVAENAGEIVTVMLFLDDATVENGCLEVIPGSHRQGLWDRSASDDPFARNELDESGVGGLDVVPLEVPAGSIVMFGPMLVHKSAPNESARERRALLYSYQPPGRNTQLEALRRNLARQRGSTDR